MNNAPDIIDEFIEDVGDFADATPGWPSDVAYGYSKGCLVIVFHIKLRGIKGEEHELCATVYRSPQMVEFRSSDKIGDKAYLATQDVLYGDIEKPMLVRIVEIPDEPKKGRQLCVASVVRLRSLDFCLRCCANSGESANPFLLKLLGPVGNGKLKSAGVGGMTRTALPNGYSVDSVVERGAQIVDTIAGYQGPPVDIGRIFDFDNLGVPNPIEAGFFGDEIRFCFNPLPEFSLESVEMFFGTSEFQQTAGEFRTDHAVYANNRSIGVSS